MRYLCEKVVKSTNSRKRSISIVFFARFSSFIPFKIIFAVFNAFFISTLLFSFVY